MPTVSVVVPNYNHALYLRQRIESILAQTYQDFELILLDDCSTDNSRQIIEQYSKDPRVRLEFNQQNSGSTFKQWNKGVQAARGTYVWIAESDDSADKYQLERLTGILENRPETAYAYCRSWKLLQDNRTAGYSDAFMSGSAERDWGKSFNCDGTEECRKNFALFNQVPNASAVVFRRGLYERAGGADERLKVCGDYKLWAGLALQGRVEYLAEPLNYFRWHAENVRTRTSSGYIAILEHMHAACWTLAHVLEESKVPDAVKLLSQGIAAELTAEQEASQCRAAASALEATILKERLAGAKEVRAAFKFYRFAVNEREFAHRTPNRLRFFTHQYQYFRYNAKHMSSRERIAYLVYLIGAPILGYRNMHWIGRISAPVKKLARTLMGRERVWRGLSPHQ